MKYDKLPICAGECSRRGLLQGLGVIGAAALVPGCAQQGSDLPTATSASCSGGVCVDLTAPANQALATPGGAMLVDGLGDTIMVIRMSQVDIVALSAICTHAGCSMNFLVGQQLLDCPCHGSQFDETGAVVRGPANRPLKVYSAALDATGQTITIA
jgi:cytochrome b6-f complex iron-sulfur subunit